MERRTDYRNQLIFRNPSIKPDNWLRNNKQQFAESFAQEIYLSNTIYSHIPKNASSTMRYSVALANGLITQETDISWVYANNMTFTPSLRFQRLADYTFVILRCPYSRLASAFLDQIVRRPHMYLMQQRKTGIRRVVVDQIIARHITFERFVLKLRDDRGFLRLNAHWRPQVDFLLYENYSDYFCVEAMNVAVDTLKSKIDLNVVDTRSLAKHGIDRFRKIDIEKGFKLSVPQFRKMKNENTILDPKCLYSKELLNIVSELYSEDIDLYKSKFGDKNLMFKSSYL